MMSLRPLLLGLILLVPFFLQAQGAGSIDKSVTPEPSALKVEPLRPSVEVGESIRLRVTLPAKGAYESFTLKLPDAQKELVHIGDARQTSADIFMVDVRPLKAGEHELGPVTIETQQRDSSSAVVMTAPGFSITVKEPPGEFTGELEDYTLPAEKEYDYFWRNAIIAGAVVVALGAAGLAAFAAIYFRRKRAANRPLPPPVPPVEQALQWVHDLSDLHVYRAEGVEEHYTRLSMALRFYLERQFGFTALEMSDDEVAALLRGPLNDHALAKELVPVMQRSSMAKFARQSLTEDVARGDCDTAEQFLVREKELLRRLAEVVRQENQSSEGARAAA